MISGRLHPATILIEFLRRLGSLAYVIVLALLLRFVGNKRTDWLEAIAAILATLTAVGAVFRYLTLRFEVNAERLMIQSGLLVRQQRSIPLERIQNISIKRGPLHRLLGAADLSIETAGGAKAEAELSALRLDEAERLKAILSSRELGPPAAAVPSEIRAEPREQLLWRASLRDLVLAGATENRAGLIMAGLAGAWYSFREVIEAILPMEQRLEALFGSGIQAAALLIAGGVVALVLAGWLASILLSVVQYYGFTLARDAHTPTAAGPDPSPSNAARPGETGDRLRQRFGMFTHQELLLPVRRIQVLRIEAPWLRRLAGFVAVYADTAASAVERQGGGASVLCPLIRRRDADAFCRNVFPGVRLNDVQWQPVSRKAIRRRAVRYFSLWAAPIAAAVYFFGWEAAWLIPGAAGLALLGGYLAYRTIGYCEMADMVLTRSGVLTRRICVIPYAKIQSLGFGQTPFQRRLDLATLSIATAGAGAARRPSLVDLPADAAASLQDRLSLRASAGAMLDGV